MENTGNFSNNNQPLPSTFDIDTATLSEETWAIARNRYHVIEPLLKIASIPVKDAKLAAKKLGCSWRTVYRLVTRYRNSGGLLSSLADQNPSGGKGKSRLNDQTDKIISEAINKHYLKRQKPQFQVVVIEVRRCCIEMGIAIPARNTIRSRLAKLTSREIITKREGADAAKLFTPNYGPYQNITHPLQLIMMDHTKVDIIIVDEKERKPIGRPWLTVAIDVFSRCITGFCLSLDPPSGVSVSLCLTHAVLEKDSFLERIGVNGTWPIFGKPEAIQVDGAKEFKSEALTRGCEQHGIHIQWRRLGAPNLNGVVERLIGTLMKEIHSLPGTTFSNITERGSYDSDAKAALTLAELEHWLTLCIVGKYHLDIHDGILEAPLSRWRKGISELKSPTIKVSNPRTFLIDFLPICRRTIQRCGFIIDHIAYFSPGLTPWIADRGSQQRFLIRRDPRDLSRIFVLHAEEKQYLEIPYRSLGRPAMTLWEHRECLRRLQERGILEVDEVAIFKTLDEMRRISQESVKKTKLARRREVSNGIASSTWKQEKPHNQFKSCAVPEDLNSIQPFSEIEDWSK